MSDALFESFPCTKCGRKLRIGLSERRQKQVTCTQCNLTFLLDDLLKKEGEIVSQFKRTFKNMRMKL